MQPFFTLLLQYKYLVIFPLAIVEGPIITIISGLLASLGFLNIFLAYVIIVLGDLTGDVLYYCLGRFGGHSPWIKKLLEFFGYSESNQKFLEDHFEKHKGKTFILGKIAHGVGATVLVAAGIAKVDIKEFLRYNALGTLPKSLLLILVGYYAGSSYVQIGKYLDWAGYVTIGLGLVFLVAYLVLSKLAKKYFSENGK